jgi:hypothetical protein
VINAEVEVVVTRESQFFSAGACLAWDEHGQFLSLIRSEADEYAANAVRIMGKSQAFMVEARPS